MGFVLGYPRTAQQHTINHNERPRNGPRMNNKTDWVFVAFIVGLFAWLIVATITGNLDKII